MNREQSLELTVNDLLRRNLYLESVIYGKNELNNEIAIDAKMVFVVVEEDSNKILGVFLDQYYAEYIASKADLPAKAHAWLIQAEVKAVVPPVLIPNGTEIIFLDNEGKRTRGHVTNCDGDFDAGVEHLLYKVLPEGLPSNSEAYIVIWHSEIMEICDDRYKIR